MQELLKQELLRYNPSFTDEEMAYGLSFFEERHFQANALISEAGSICDHLFFSESSITNCYYLDDEGEKCTLWMKPERTFITEYKSFVNREKSQFSLQFYEDTSAFLISRESLAQLYKTYNNWALFGIALTEQVHITLIDVFVNLLANDATRNYEYIAYMFPRFLQVAPLKDIASMLQISPVSLSRIRSGTQLKK